MPQAAAFLKVHTRSMWMPAAPPETAGTAASPDGPSADSPPIAPSVALWDMQALFCIGILTRVVQRYHLTCAQAITLVSFPVFKTPQDRVEVVCRLYGRLVDLDNLPYLVQVWRPL